MDMVVRMEKVFPYGKLKKQLYFICIFIFVVSTQEIYCSYNCALGSNKIQIKCNDCAKVVNNESGIDDLFTKVYVLGPAAT